MCCLLLLCFVEMILSFFFPLSFSLSLTSYGRLPPNPTLYLFVHSFIFSFLPVVLLAYPSESAYVVTTMIDA